MCSTARQGIKQTLQFWQGLAASGQHHRLLLPSCSPPVQPPTELHRSNLKLMMHEKLSTPSEGVIAYPAAALLWPY